MAACSVDLAAVFRFMSQIALPRPLCGPVTLAAATLIASLQILELLARIDNITDRRYAGSVIVNEGNARYFETAASRSGLVSLRYQRRW